MMAGRVDQKYLALHREYVQALRQWGVAVEVRKRRLAAKAAWEATPHPRRPVGAPADFAFPEPEPPRTPKPQPLSRYYMGPILGWVEFQHAPTPEELPDPTASFDVNAVFDQIHLDQFNRARDRYVRARRALTEYVERSRRSQMLSRMDAHGRRARSLARHAGRLQQLGLDSEEALKALRAEVEELCKDAWAAYGGRPLHSTTPQGHRAQASILVGAAEKAAQVGSEVAVEMMLAGARRQINAACEKAWEIYQKAPTPKSEADVRRMLESLQEAKLFGVESQTVSDMELELTRRLRAPGKLDPIGN